MLSVAEKKVGSDIQITPLMHCGVAFGTTEPITKHADSPNNVSRRQCVENHSQQFNIWGTEMLLDAQV